MTETIRARNVILGAGAMGTAAAYHLARRGEPVLLVEQFTPGHARGSSHGAARITRHSYSDPRYARLMLDAFAAWRQLEADSGQCLYIRTGGVSFCPGRHDYAARVAQSLAAIGVAHRQMSGADWNGLQPEFRLPGDYDVVFEPDAGILSAARALAAQIELARSLGGDATRVLDGCRVDRIDLDGARPILLAGNLRIEAERLVVAAGAWAGRLLPGLDVELRPTRQQVLYMKPADTAAYAIGRFPAFIYIGETPQDAFYGMPDFLATGVKAARHHGPEVDPDLDDREPDPDYAGCVQEFLRRHLPALAKAPIVSQEVCLYTIADGENFRVGHWPGRSDVVLASPCSGHGFKFACLVGRVVADLMIRGETDVDISPWALPMRA
jgi:sarcosine oxidase